VRKFYYILFLSQAARDKSENENERKRAIRIALVLWMHVRTSQAHFFTLKHPETNRSRPLAFGNVPSQGEIRLCTMKATAVPEEINVT